MPASYCHAKVLAGILQPNSCWFLNSFWQPPCKCVVSSSPILNIINFKICRRALVHIFAAASKGNSSLSLKVLVVMAKIRFISI